MTHALTGGCLCGAVGFRVADAFDYALHCHCSQCRRATGAAYKPFAGIARAHFAFTHGAEHLLTYGDAITHDARCRTCGSLLYSQVREGTTLHIPLGVLIDTPTIRPSAHIFVGSKAEWHEITDDLPRHDAFP